MTRRERRIREACCKPSGLSDKEHESHVQRILGVIHEAKMKRRERP